MGKGIVLAILFCLVVSGCEVIAPDISKAISESEQVELNKRQVAALERIATVLERLSNDRGESHTR
jgi:hypothetical protein